MQASNQLASPVCRYDARSVFDSASGQGARATPTEGGSYVVEYTDAEGAAYVTVFAGPEAESPSADSHGGSWSAIGRFCCRSRGRERQVGPWL